MQQVTRWRFTVHGYRQAKHKRRGQTLRSATLPGLAPTVDQILG